MYNKFILISFLLTPLILLLSFKIAKFVNLYDYPDKIRKKHKEPTLIVGGFFFLILFFFLFSLYFFVFKDFFINEEVENVIILLITFSIIFLVGYFDDKKNLNPLFKLLIIYFIYIISLYFLSENFSLYRLEFFSNLTVYLYKFSILFTSLCFLILLNASNMADGINSLLSIIYTIWIFFITILLPFESLYFSINIILIFGLILFSYLNFKNKCFLGDSGCYILASYLSFTTVYVYNSDLNTKSYFLNIESIFLLFLLPGLDMIRLFIKRIYENTNPLKGDTNHLHHILNFNYGIKKTLIIYSLLIIFPWILYSIFSSLLIYLIFSVLVIYLYLINHKKNEKN